MEELILNYLEKNYTFNLSTLSSYQLKDKVNGNHIYLTELFSNIYLIFGITSVEFESIWDKWANEKIIELNNRIVEIQYILYETNGNEFEITPEAINSIINKE
jgi:hypothetical protein